MPNTMRSDLGAISAKENAKGGERVFSSHSNLVTKGDSYEKPQPDFNDLCKPRKGQRGRRADRADKRTFSIRRGCLLL
jgi:hypothetical protein